MSTLADLAAKYTPAMLARRCACGRSLARSGEQVQCAKCRMGQPSSTRALERELATVRAEFDRLTTTWAPATLAREDAARRRERRQR